MKRILSFFLLLILPYIGYGQLSQGGIPYSLQLRAEYPNENILSSNIPVFNMPIDQSIIEKLKEDNNKELESYQFAYPFDVNIDMKAVATRLLLYPC